MTNPVNPKNEVQRPAVGSRAVTESNESNVRRLVGCVAIVLMVVLRIVWPDSDAYPRLSWSTALLTDEGFYIHNARNLVLFGHERLDGFNNMLIMPLLHVVQIAVFRMFGVGVVQARMISVVSSLATLVLFWDGLRIVWGKTVANWCATFLGLDHANLLYNRLGLMDTPCVLLMVGAWWAYARASCCYWGRFPLNNQNDQDDQSAFSDTSRCPVSWWMLCGILLGLAYAVRGLAALIWWIPVWAGLSDVKFGKGLFLRAVLRPVGWYLFGLGTILALYIALWWWPHRAEIGHVSGYYIGHQLIPHSIARFADNLHKSMDWERGFFPYLFKHTPVQFLFALGGLITQFMLSRRRQPHNPAMNAEIRTRRGAETYFYAWFLVFGLFCCCVNYSPSRYYVLFYPAMAAISAFTLERISGFRPFGRRAATFAVALWAIVNCAWMYDWLAHITYRQRQADQWLAAHLPPDSVVLGDIAPGLCMNNRLRAVNVIEYLCNDDHPVERVGAAPGYILILDNRHREKWWLRHYAALLTPDRRLHTFSGVLRPFFFIGLYPANERATVEFQENRHATPQNDR